jgi:hypothetical protein
LTISGLEISPASYSKYTSIPDCGTIKAGEKHGMYGHNREHPTFLVYE